MAAKYIDLLITDDDLTQDVAGEPQLIYDRDCITQDIKHLIRDSGLLVEIVGERDDNKVQIKLNQLTLLIEDDQRLVPGTVEITRVDTETFFITADTYEFGAISLQVSN